MRTPQQALADAIKSGAVQAFADGKKIQVAGIEHPEDWIDATPLDPNFCGQSIIWRPAPTPRLRPWKNGSEVPKLAIYRNKTWDKDAWSLITGAASTGIECSKYNQIVFISLEEALEEGEHSLDGGKTWHPCGVQEGGE